MTPHWFGDRDPRRGPARAPAVGPGKEDVTRWTAALQDHVALAGIDLRLLPGAEVSFDPGLLDDARALVTLGGSRALLLELPAQGVPLSVGAVVFRLQLAGYTP